MKRSRRQGLTLIELTISIAVLSLIAAAAAALLFERMPPVDARVRIGVGDGTRSVTESWSCRCKS